MESLVNALKSEVYLDEDSYNQPPTNIINDYDEVFNEKDY
jgi:hypothetical protein